MNTPCPWCLTEKMNLDCIKQWLYMLQYLLQCFLVLCASFVKLFPNISFSWEDCLMIVNQVCFMLANYSLIIIDLSGVILLKVCFLKSMYIFYLTISPKHTHTWCFWSPLVNVAVKPGSWQWFQISSLIIIHHSQPESSFTCKFLHLYESFSCRELVFCVVSNIWVLAG